MSQSQYTPQPMAQTSTLAIVSLVSGIVSWFLLPLIGAVIAVITGHMARREIRDSLGALTGDGLALAGLILGYLQLALTVLGVCFFIALLALGLTPLVCVPFANELGLWLAPYLGF
jgi:hypothetical protein